MKGVGEISVLFAYGQSVHRRGGLQAYLDGAHVGSFPPRNCNVPFPHDQESGLRTDYADLRRATGGGRT